MNNAFLIRHSMQSSGNKRFKIRYNCMKPLINNDDEILVDLNIQNLYVGQIILVIINDTIKCHRVLYIDEKKKFVLTKGDNTYQTDGVVRTSNIIGIFSKKIINNDDERQYSYSTLDKTIAYFSYKESLYFNKVLKASRMSKILFRLLLFLLIKTKKIIILVAYLRFVL